MSGTGMESMPQQGACGIASHLAADHLLPERKVSPLSSAGMQVVQYPGSTVVLGVAKRDLDATGTTFSTSLIS